MEDDHLVHEMAEAIASGQAVFFVGAGMSLMAGAPSWDELVAPLRRRLKPPTEETNPLLIAQFYENQHGANKLHAELQRQLNAKRLEPTRAHKALCSMPVPVFVTTNYDDLLEVQLGELNVPYSVVMNENDLGLWDEKSRVQILKLHGDLRSARSIVLTHWDYVRFMNDRPLTKRKLSELFCYRTVIFLGYSLRDPNVSFIFNQISYQLGDLKRPAYIVTLDSDPHLHHEWDRRGVRPVCLAKDQQGLVSSMKAELMTDLLWRLYHLVRETNRSIMIVDDDPQIVTLFTATLTTAIKDANVCTAKDGLAAMYALGRVRPRLLIIDLMMPQLDGWELIKMIRHFPELDATRIMVISGDPQALDPEKMKEFHVDDALAKPVATHDLVSKALSLLETSAVTKTRSALTLRESRQSFAPVDTSFPPRREVLGSDGARHTS